MSIINARSSFSAHPGSARSPISPPGRPPPATRALATARRTTWWSCVLPASRGAQVNGLRGAGQHGELARPAGAAWTLLGQARQRPSGPAMRSASNRDHTRVHPAITAAASVIRSRCSAATAVVSLGMA